MTIPEIRERMHVLAQKLRKHTLPHDRRLIADELDTLAEATRKRYFGRATP